MVPAEPCPGKRVEDMLESSRESSEPQECRRREKKTCLHGFHYTRDFRSGKVLDCSKLREINLTTGDTLSSWALHNELYELGKQERTNR